MPGDAKEHEYRVYLDGNQWCAVTSGFVNLQESDAQFGNDPLAALANLIRWQNGAAARTKLKG